MEFDRIVVVLVALVLAAWTVAAAWAILAARHREKRAEATLRSARRLGRMVDESPALPLLVRSDGRIEASPKLAQWLGLDSVPQYLSELDAGERGLPADKLAELTQAVLRAQKTAASFRMVATPRGSTRSLALRGCLADPQVSPGGAALVWVFDFSDSESELVKLREEAARARGDFSALVALIEAAPMPMWFRRADGSLQLVNSAYVAAVGGENAQAVVDAGTELVEAVDGLTARQVALQAAAKNVPIERIVSLTIAKQRRAFRVHDLPLGSEGIAGYAVDIEDMEELGRSFRAFREAQRAMLDQLSAGVAQFDAKKRLTFANQPFQRLFKLGPAAMIDPPAFERLLELMRDAARLPEVRDFPAWRREKAEWFAASETQEEAWPLGDGTHLRIVAQPVPDGGLLLIVEDRTEQLRLSAIRDTLLRTRTATFDSLFESVAVFAPDGRMQLWNRRFAADWGLESDFLDTHPHVEDLLGKIGPRLSRPAQAKAVGDTVRAATLDRKETGGRVALADGRTLEFAGVPLPDGNGLLIVLDITDSQKAETALRERNAALVEADAVKTRFLANMSYELRTPLTSIGGFAELLQAGVGCELDENGRDYVQAILNSAARLGEQIESILDLSQSEAGLLPLALEDIELMPLVKAVVEERAAPIRQCGLTLDLQGNGLVGTIRGDRRRLARALGHLVDNAISATPRGGRILVQVTRERHGTGDVAQIVVSDNGAGMDERALARALDGVKVSADGKTIERRQGLGLPLARQLIEAHGGTLRLMSEPGQGTAAIVELP
ncbi:sensor histidine kinase [Novosphingobium album (ex Liu et al. 2023)]|uniref:histidine kinase n=1 Tax=Novosphingobium album (ex Liu et al. 2023) TaxID=3031130 RepID=A0ABT5WRA4_9SPHN|nr:PAS domain-containing sensor histidine kinase [Novosphingobium album (ex Liu et al. 2023)]MDE8652581.1 PAS-domain containing protein [Novosphingobium album (ex Liu et al. 2023)]